MTRTESGAPDRSPPIVRGNSSSPEGRDHPPKKVKMSGNDARSGSAVEGMTSKLFHWQFSHAKDCSITEDPGSVAHLVRHFKPAGCPLPSMRNMTEREAYVKTAVAHAKVDL